MCGVVGYIGAQNASSVLVNGLRRLEYRGYDSAGVAVLNGDSVAVRRSVGKLHVLEALLQKNPVIGTVGLGHTRWATHGRPSEENAHPHTCCNGNIVVVHNGIIENYMELKNRLTAEGHRFKSQTDTEVLAHLIEEHYKGHLLDAVRNALIQVRGSYAIGVISEEDPGRLIAARKDSPLVLGVGENETFLASDIPALLSYTRNMIILEDGDIAELTQEGVKIFEKNGLSVVRPPQAITGDALMAEKSGYEHFMLKEIFEQQKTIPNTYRSRISTQEGRVLLDDILPMPTAITLSKVCLIGCGTSYHAALVARFWIEEIARVPCTVEIASEYRYRRFTEEKGTLVVAITQSGETADTLSVLRRSKAQGLTTLALSNVVGSTAARDAAHAFYTHCGPEIGVASTKAFTGQLTALFILALYLGQCRGTVTPEMARLLLEELSRLPASVCALLEQAGRIKTIAQDVSSQRNFLYLGRHLNYPIALEGALKLKEISYIHAEGFPAGEMKHGPIALIDAEMPVVAIVTASSVREKMLSNMEEVKARGGRLIALSTENDAAVENLADYVLTVPRTHEYLAPLLSVIPLQLLAYYIAVLRGCDVDQPRNLAKSVTVE
ncbi:MAG: glutamine--fructose-6-phosphate aminotransferase [Elusimicrobia bacterium RIFCSPLOWO2_01_FULL_59_12]|nr:MAG: glutamine--fructose-6-phosphate aminotransferase [Elusimicrobia bacterium RIFCSPLOWO2_01_FULL_59_12]